MTNYKVTTPEELRSLCIRKNWFTSGDLRQYEKLFEANENGSSIEEISAIIWVCSKDVSKEEILDELKKAQEDYHICLGEQVVANGERSADEVYCGYYDS